MIPRILILDTNVISEVARPTPDERVLAWYLRQPSNELYTTTVTQAEVVYGIELLDPGRRKDELTAFAQEFFRVEMLGRVLPLDGAAAMEYGRIRAARRKAGRTMHTMDAQIAAIAAVHGAAVATRNVTDLEDCGVRVVNPWAEVYSRPGE